MNRLPLTIRYTPHPQRDACAWLVPGSTPADWVRAITSSNVKQKDVRIFLLPTGRQNRQPSAALVTLASAGSSAGDAYIVGGLPYGKLGEQLYLPAEAELLPHAREQELADLLSGQMQYIWAPQTGLVACEPEEIFSLADLLQAPAAGQSNWGWAQPGVILAPRLLSIVPLTAPDFDSFLEQARDDIGSEGDSLDELPPSDKESTPGPMNAARRWSRETLARAAKWLAQRAPTMESGSPTWINKLENWASRTLAAAGAANLANRFKELNRLAELLDSNPDEGLKYALPMGGAAHRGVAPPSDRLGARDVNFNLGAINSGGPADYWDVPPDLHQRLMARYRALASREMRLGRYRRAAYIYAELLGDLNGAAGALKTGHHWREAAALYRDKLNDHTAAAQCLEKGGLWTEAIALYEELRKFEKVGDLYRQLEDEEAAKKFYFKEAGRVVIEAGDYLAAARILEQKVGDVELAIEQLKAGWPKSTQRRVCLGALFEICGRHGLHDQATARLQQARAPETELLHILEDLEVISQFAGDYPDREVRELAADTTRVLAARRLSSATGDDAARLVATVTRLAPSDRLLHRDGQRYLQRQRAEVRPPAVPSILPGEIRTLYRFRLPECRTIHAATWITQTLYIVGEDEQQRLRIWRTRWFDEVSTVTELMDSHILAQNFPGDARVIATADSFSDSRVLVHGIRMRGHDREILAKSLPGTDLFPAIDCGPETGVSHRTIGASRSSGYTWLANVDMDGEPVLNCYSGGVVLNSRLIDIPSQANDMRALELPIPMHARGGYVYVGIGDQLQIYGRADAPECHTLGSPAIEITGSLRHTRARIAVACQHGAEMFWAESTGDGTPFARNLFQPAVGLLTGGLVIAVDATQILAFNSANRKLPTEAQANHAFGEPVSVMASAHHPQQAAIAFRNGNLAFFQL